MIKKSPKIKKFKKPIKFEALICQITRRGA